MGHGATDFEFLHGEWRVTHRKLAQRLAGCSEWISFPGTLQVGTVAGHRGNFDINWLDDPTGRYEAHSLRLYDPIDSRWLIWWVDWRRPEHLDPPVIGGFAGTSGSFFSDDSFDGQPIRVRTTYQSIDDRRAEWTQAFARAGTDDWEVNWVMEFERNG